MAQLSAEDRERIQRGLMRYWSGLFESLGDLTKQELLAAVNATDTWIDDNQVSYNTALPEPAKTELTQDQKTLMFCAVALMRVSLPFLRQVFGEVD
ncbi:MAG: hypothetical protein GWN58_08130 [Anaerolineae bacterium]|nr:hypothetical protein [Anaerolineae bacterium]